MISEATSWLTAARKTHKTDSDQIVIDVRRVINETADEWTGLLTTKIKGAFVLTGTQSNAGLYNLGVRIDLERFDKQAVAFAKSRVAKIQMKIDDETLQRVSKRVAMGIQRGDATADTAKDIRDLFDEMSVSRSELIAQVETGIAASSGDYQNANLTGLDLMKIWSNSADDKVRPSHQIREAVGMDEQFSNGMLYPLWPEGPIEEIANCFPAETVMEGSIVGAFKAWYEGPMIEIFTNSGHSLSVTPNHPILTVLGFKRAGEIRNGDNLLCNRARVERIASTRIMDDKNNLPAKIEEIFDSLRLCASETSRKVRVDDFHGDGVFVQGNIDIVRADSMLLRNDRKLSFQLGEQTVFEDSTMKRSFANGSRSRTFDSHGIALLPSSRPSVRALSQDSVSIRLSDTPFDKLRFGAASQFNASIFQKTSNGLPSDVNLVRQLLDGSSVHVFCDHVIQIREYYFRGHVYDLQSSAGWIVANGVFVSNCRCAVLYVPSDEVDQWL